MKTYDGMRELDALIAIDGGGKWVLAEDVAELQEYNKRLRSVTSFVGRDKCLCGSKKPHFCPPSFGDPGFFACDSKDLGERIVKLEAEIKDMKLDAERERES